MDFEIEPLVEAESICVVRKYQVVLFERWRWWLRGRGLGKGRTGGVLKGGVVAVGGVC